MSTSEPSPHRESPPKLRSTTTEAQHASQPREGLWSQLTTIPRPVKNLFDAVPLRVYARNELPVRARRRERLRRDGHTLWVWIGEGDEQGRGMSFNPGCLKWQAYLRFLGIRYTNVSSNNHASPGGALPFLIPKSSADESSSTAIPSSKLRKWALKESSRTEDGSEETTPINQARYDAYLSLIEHRIRRAWLYTLHHTPLFQSLTIPLYIHAASTSPFIRHSLSTSLLASATAELQKHTTVIEAKDIYSEAEEAFAALENLLGEQKWFFGREEPGWFDACVFAYTGLILRGEEEGQGWEALRSSELATMLEVRGGLVRHRERILKHYFEQE